MQTNAGWLRGIRIGDARDGAVSACMPDATPEANPPARGYDYPHNVV